MAFKAAVIAASGASALPEIINSLPSVGEHEVLIKNYSIASNPADWKSLFGHFHATAALKLQYPLVLGLDVSGVIENVGSKVTHFKKGDRVCSFLPWALNMPQTKYGGFQEYSVGLEQSTIKIPESLPFDEAATIPLGITTAAVRLFIDLELKLPTLGAADSKGETILIWGGSSSVGLFAIQLARLAGYTVVTTASKRNHDLVRSLGASVVVDYADSDVIAQLRKAGPIHKALDAISENGTVELCMQVVEDNGKVSVVHQYNKPSIKGVEIKNSFVGVVWVPEGKEFSNSFYTNYLEPALAKKLVVANPIQHIEGWIDGIQNMLEIHSKGVSGVKLVVSRK